VPTRPAGEGVASSPNQSQDAAALCKPAGPTRSWHVGPGEASRPCGPSATGGGSPRRTTGGGEGGG
jgi:hypothetical protein